MEITTFLILGFELLPEVMKWLTVSVVFLKVSAKEAKDLHLVTEVFEGSRLYEEVWPRLQAAAKLPIKSLVYSKALSRDVYRDTLHKVRFMAFTLQEHMGTL